MKEQKFKIHENFRRINTEINKQNLIQTPNSINQSDIKIQNLISNLKLNNINNSNNNLSSFNILSSGVQ